MWVRIFVVLLLSFSATAQAEEEPITTVYFGVPALTLETISSGGATPPQTPPVGLATPHSAALRSELASDAPRAAIVPAECPREVVVRRNFGGVREEVRMALVDCDGRAREEARRALSILARARETEPPSEDEIRRWREREGDPELLAEGVRLIDVGLLERLSRLGTAFDGHAIEIVSAYRPSAPDASRHHHARALDLTVEGVAREAVRDFLTGLPQTGVGWYPNSTFVHMDVREASAYWVDESAPGEAPRYVSGAEPPRATDDELARSRREVDRFLEGLRVPIR